MIPPLVYAHLIKYLTEYAARQIAARLGLQVTPPARTPTEPVQNRTESAPVVRIPDDAFEIPSFDPVKETLSEEERLNRHTEYEHAQLRFRIEEQGLAEQRAELEQERRALEESRNPEKLAAEEARRHQEVFDAENRRKLEEQQEYFRQQDAAKQKDAYDQAGRDKERQEKEAAAQKEQQEKQAREEYERRKQELEKEERSKA